MKQKKICITFPSHIYHNTIKLFLRHFPEMLKTYFYHIVIKMWWKCDEYFFDSITYSWHFYDNLIKMLEIHEFVMKMTWWKNEINFALKFHLKELKKQPTKFDYDYEDGWTFQLTLSEKTNNNFTKKGWKCDGLALVLIFWPHPLKVIWIFPPREILMSDARCLDVDACVAPAIQENYKQ